MSWVATAVVGGTLVGGYLQHDAAKDAAGAQRDAAGQSLAAQLEIARMQDAYAREAFNRSQAAMWPTQVGGNRAQSQLSALLGLGYLPTNSPFDTERAYLQQQISALGGPVMSTMTPPKDSVLPPGAVQMVGTTTPTGRKLPWLYAPAPGGSSIGPSSSRGGLRGVLSRGAASTGLGGAPTPEGAALREQAARERGDASKAHLTDAGRLADSLENAENARRLEMSQAFASAVGGTSKLGVGLDGLLSRRSRISDLAEAAVPRLRDQEAQAQAQAQAQKQDQQSQLKLLMDRYAAIPNEPAKQMGPDEARADALKGFYKDPGYEFRLSEGQKVLDRVNAARGRLGGAGVKDLLRFNQGVASDEYGRYISNLQSMAGLAPVAAQSQGASAMNLGGQLGQIAQGIGDARTSAYQQIGSANSMQSISRGNQIAGFTNSLLNMDWGGGGLSKLFGGGGGGNYGGSFGNIGGGSQSPVGMDFFSYTNQ